MLPELIAFFRASFLQQQPHRYAVMQPENADRKYDDFTGQLSNQQIGAHLAGRTTFAVPYVVNDLANVLALDIDAGGITAAGDLLETAAARGLWAFATMDTSRNRGYVYVPFDDLTNPARIHELGQQLIAQVQRPGYNIENRAHGADTRLPFARHAWNQRRGILVYQDGLLADLDQPDETYYNVLVRFVQAYRPNPTSALPPAPAAPERPQRTVTREPRQGVTIAQYNAENDLETLLDHYGAKPAKGRGQKLYFCPFHSDNHASLLVARDGQRCRCLSTASGCPLGEKWHDAFSIFCVGEAITPQQALRRLNGLPDDPTSSGSSSPISGSGQAGNARSDRNISQRSNAPPTASKAAQRPAQTATAPQTTTTASDGRRTPEGCPGQPKTARRIWAVIAQHQTYRQGVPTLARLLDVDQRTVQRNLRRLEAAGHIRRIKRGNFQTDLYELAPPRQMPPTVVLEFLPDVDQEETKRGGNHPASVAEQERQRPADVVPSDEPGAAETCVSAPVVQDEDGAIYGPVGAIMYPNGAGFVPAGAEAWYDAMMQAQATQRQAEQPTAETSVSAPAQMPLDNAATRLPPEHDRQQDAEKPTPRRRRATSKPPRFVTPGELVGRIVAATRKADKLARGNAAQRRQARAIRYQVQQLERQLASLRAELDSSEAQAAGPPQATADSIQPAASGQPPTSPEIAPLLASCREQMHRG